MKNVIKLFALVLLFTMYSCGNQGPADVAKSAMTCLQNEDYKGYVDLMEVNESLSPEEVEKEKAAMANILHEKAEASINKKGGIKNFKVIKESVNEEKDTANVRMEVYYNDGSSKKTNCKLRKSNDGKWYMTM